MSRDAAASLGRAPPGAPGIAPGACSGDLGSGGKRGKWEENQQRKLSQGAWENLLDDCLAEWR